jgi:hypothetical protein
MSTLLDTTIANTRYQLPRLIARYASGEALKPHHPHAIATLFRRLGISRMFSEGVAEPLFLGQMQAAGAYLFGLRLLNDEDKVTSRAGAFWDAVGGEYWNTASEIVRHTRMTTNPTWEHEDDFLYVAFLMTRYFLGPAVNDSEKAAAHMGTQRAMLKRWEDVLEGGADPRLPLCMALVLGDAEAFWAALLDMAEAREADLRTKVADGKLSEEDAAWFRPFWGEGLALLRLAERDGLSIVEGCPMVPEIARARNSLAFDPHAWTRPELLE